MGTVLQAPGGVEILVILLLVLIPLVATGIVVWFVRRTRGHRTEFGSKGNEVDAERVE